MDKFTTLNNIEEGASAGNSFIVNNCTNTTNISDNYKLNDNNVPESIHKMDKLEGKTTINSLEVHRARFSPPTSQSKTDETTKTLIIKNETDITSNKINEGNPQLFKNVQQLNIVAEDQGRKNKSKENEGTKDTPSDECIQKAVMSESLSNLLAYGSSSEDSETNSARSSVYQSDSECDLEEISHNENRKASSSNGNDTDSLYRLSAEREGGSEENINKPVKSERCSSNDSKNVIKTVEKYRRNNTSSTEEESSESDER